MFTFSKKNVEYCLSFLFIYLFNFLEFFIKASTPVPVWDFFFGGGVHPSDLKCIYCTSLYQCIPFSGFDLMSLYLLEDFVTRGQWGEISMAGQLFSSIYIIQRRWVKSFVFVWFFDVSIHGVWEKDQSSGSKQKRGKSIPFY